MRYNLQPGMHEEIRVIDQYKKINQYSKSKKSLGVTKIRNIQMINKVNLK